MFLERIVATKKIEVARLSESFVRSEAEKRIAELPSCIGFVNALNNPNRSMGLIAEVKKASPSKGLIRADFDPVSIAETYEASGTDCISVLTDVDYFQGANEYLTQVRQAVGVPLLRKDFTIDWRQIYEARLLGADAILLIAAILTTDQMREYIEIAGTLGMDALVEVHDLEELERALSLDLRLIGINNRNLKTFVTDIRTTEALIRHIPSHITVVSESGISSPNEISYLTGLGVRAVLVGEQFMRQPSVGQAVVDLMSAPATGKGV